MMKEERMMLMPTGNLGVVLRTASGALPINNGSIAVENETGKTVFYEFLTAVNSGISRMITLETPPRSLSLESDETIRPYSVYSVLVRADRSYTMRISGVQMFENSTTHLPIDLVPLPEGVVSADDENEIDIIIPEHILRRGGASSGPPPTPEELDLPTSAVPAVNIAGGVYIPETITVHLGAPDEDASNVTLPFIDYIKNVASSEVYPTWPTESLTANIIAQISLTLNRIYTEWYPSRGYNFDITNTTAFDQAFVLGRNIFDEMSVLVDELFDNYLVRPNRIEPLYASYCNGTTTTCAGMSQWGTVALAESGQSAEDILGFYYGNVSITETDDIRSPEPSYSGTPLSAGSMGEDVRIIQEQLNRIAINFPLIPLIEVNSVYNTSTSSSVREFQRLFVLPVTGVVDKATWYRISQIYSSVKRLAEITSEGQRASYNQQLYPGDPLRRGARGSEVQEIQFYLRRISRFNPVVESPALDGIFGGGTERAVISFQNAYGLTPNGIIAEPDWDRLVEVYNGTLDNVDEPSDSIGVIPFPNETFTVGSRGEYVKYIQQSLNIVNNVFLTVPEIAEDGIFGSETARAVNAFSALFGYPQSSAVDATVWRKLTEITQVVERNCIFKSGDSSGARPYSGTPLTIGSSGSNVGYIQSRINIIYSAIPIVGSTVVDNRYGSETEASVRTLQRIFGLDETGVVDESTWLLADYVTASIEQGCLPRMTATVSHPLKPDEDVDISISALKNILRDNGVAVGTGPIFGLKSRRALSAWQIENGLEPTGLPDRETRAYLGRNFLQKRKK